MLARTETGQTYDTALWHTLAAELGCAGLPIPEEHGGAGAPTARPPSWPRSSAARSRPVPFLGSAVVATAALLAAGDEDCSPRWPRRDDRGAGGAVRRPLPGARPRADGRG